MPCATAELQREYQRRWIAARRASWLAGKSCVGCGGRDRLEVDHIDRTQKVSHRVWSWSEGRRNAELAKCQVLCHSCHVTKSVEELGHSFHGTRGYRNGCRCEVCTEAHRISVRAWRHRCATRSRG